jgi:hypothetical protein
VEKLNKTTQTKNKNPVNKAHNTPAVMGNEVSLSAGGKEKAIKEMNELYRRMDALLQAMINCDAPEEWREESLLCFHYWTRVMEYIKTGKITEY